MSELRAFSYGGGVQSTACLVLAAERRIDFPLFLFANVGDDSEHPETLQYVREIAVPYAEEHEIELTFVYRQRRDGSRETLLEQTFKNDKALPLPMRLGDSGAPGNRTCTNEFKVRPIARHLHALGATPDRPATVGIGFSVDEWERVKDSRFASQVFAYPLLDLDMTRQDCANVIRAAGLPLPRPSSCYFCPFHKLDEWQRMSRGRPDLFAKSLDIERRVNEKRERAGLSRAWLTRYGRPLDEVVNADQTAMFDDDESCGSGHCFT